jgi:hypothetical protein
MITFSEPFTLFEFMPFTTEYGIYFSKSRIGLKYNINSSSLITVECRV